MKNEKALSGTYDTVQPAAPDRKFSLGDKVRKIKGAEWHGKVVGFYSTSLTPVGYCVESAHECGSVQIYPEAALDRWPEGELQKWMDEIPAAPDGWRDIARPGEEYHEDMGDVIWWRFPIDEPPYCGMPNDMDWPGYHTHWTPLRLPLPPRNGEKA